MSDALLWIQGGLGLVALVMLILVMGEPLTDADFDERATTHQEPQA